MDIRNSWLVEVLKVCDGKYAEDFAEIRDYLAKGTVYSYDSFVQRIRHYCSICNGLIHMECEAQWNGHIMDFHFCCDKGTAVSVQVQIVKKLDCKEASKWQKLM